MNYLIRLSALFALALFGVGNCVTAAQEGKSNSDSKIELDEKQIEEWADKHAEAWEKWGEKFESKMEKWAQSQEKQWENWAEKYSQRWEDWAEKIESGEIKPEEIQAVVERNLEMLKEMPLESLIDGALKEGLGELKNAPLDSLSDLQGLIGGSLEQSLQAMEEELAMVAESEIKNRLKDLNTKDLHEAIKKLQGAIEIKNAKNEQDAAGTISLLETMLKKSSNLEAKEKDKILAHLHRELADARALQSKHDDDVRDLKDRAMSDRAKAKAMAATHAMAAAQKAQEMAHLAEMLAQKQKDDVEAVTRKDQLAAYQAERQRAKEKALLAKKRSIENSKLSEAEVVKKSLAQYYSDLKEQKAELESKESAIEAMKREIQELRKEVERMKKKQGKRDSGDNE